MAPAEAPKGPGRSARSLTPDSAPRLLGAPPDGARCDGGIVMYDTAVWCRRINTRVRCAVVIGTEAKGAESPAPPAFQQPRPRLGRPARRVGARAARRHVIERPCGAAPVQRLRQRARRLQLAPLPRGGHLPAGGRRQHSAHASAKQPRLNLLVEVSTWAFGRGCRDRACLAGAVGEYGILALEHVSGVACAPEGRRCHTTAVE